MTSPSLELQLFGPFAAIVRGEPLPRLRSRKGCWLLALLALRQGREISRDWLAGTLWPESERSQAYYNLRQCLTNLRQALGTEAALLHSPTPQTLRLDRDRVQVDVTAFDGAMAEGSLPSLERAVSLYRGPLLEGCAEEWAASERIARELSCLAALQTLAAEAARQDPAASVRYLRRMIAADPFREAVHCALMQALTAGGDFAAATQVYRDLRLLLHRELNTTPAPETEACYRGLQARNRRPFHTLISPSEHAAPPPPRRLPIPLTGLIGREKNVEEVVGLLRTDRLVTLTGAGGVGKTRLSLAVGEALATAYPDGVWFVELAALSDPESIPSAVAKTLNLRERAPLPLPDVLIEALASRSLLLILDNGEHLLEGCAALADRLLGGCANLHLLLTSRQSLGLMGERVYRVPSLALPPLSRTEPTEAAALQEYAGIRLFVERASQWQPDFRLTQRNADTVFQICRRLDGIPLAIELAAARVRSLSVEEIHARLQEDFALLRGGGRTALPRHQTLRALIDWSHALLTEAEQTALRRLSVFAGGWTLEAAEAVAGKGLLDLLTSLVDKSLVIAETQMDVTRYRMLETIRQYAQERLLECGETREIVRRHLDYFLELAEASRAPDHRRLQAEWLERLEREHDNLRAALLRCSNVQDGAEAEFRLTTALYSFWHLRGSLREGREYLLRAAAHAEKRGQARRQAQALIKAGALARLQGDLEEARNALEQALMLSQAVEDTEVEAYALILLGSIALTLRDDRAAAPLLERALATIRKSGYRIAESECLVWMGDAARWQGDYKAARSFYEEGLTIAQTLSDGWFEANATAMMAELALIQGETDEAAELARRSLQGYLKVGDRTYCMQTLGTIAGVALAQGRLERAAQLFAVVEEMLKLLQAPLPTPDHERHIGRIREVRKVLGEEQFAAACESGRSMDWSQVVACALEDAAEQDGGEKHGC